MPATSTARQLTFTIPGNPPVKVIATENNGKIDFTVDVQDTAQLTGDLRGFFFDLPDAKQGGAKVAGTQFFTQGKVGSNAIMDLGNGVTMAAKTAAKFDVGIEVGTAGKAIDDVSGAFNFTLSNSLNNLTLDDIAGQRFGAKVDSVGMVGTARTGTSTVLMNATAAPNAKDDLLTIKEDGAGAGANTLAGASAASAATKAVTLNVLANDTDADRDPLTIVSIAEQPTHGVVTIAADGKSLLYTPTQNYAGTDTIVYGISDGKGGLDFARATVNITPVADAPVISFTTGAGAHVNETVIHVTARLTDLDGSESISAINGGPVGAGQTLVAAAGAAGVLHAVAGQAGVYEQDFVLTTPQKADAHQNVSFTAVAREVLNGATAMTEGTTRFDYDYSTQTDAVQFTAYDRSMWSEGAAFKIDYENFLGIDLGSFDYRASVGVDIGIASGSVFAGVEYAFKAGLDVKFHVTGGEVDATADYDITVDSSYNRTTDVLQIDTAGLLTNQTLLSESPNGSLYLAAIAKVIARVYAGFEVSTPEIDLGLLGTIPGISYEHKFTLLGFEPIDQTYVLVDAKSEGAQTSVDLPEPFDVISVDFAWPTIRTEGSSSGSTLQNTGESVNFLQANLDIDALIVKIVDAVFFGGSGETPNFLHFEHSEGPLSLDMIIYDASLYVGSNFLQTLTTELGAVNALMHLEDGSTRSFHLGDSLTFTNASAIDLAGNHDGHVDFWIDWDPQATLENDIDLGFNVGYEHTIGQISVDVDLGIGSFGGTLGPVVKGDYNLPLGSIGIYDQTFALDFASQHVNYIA